MFAARDQAHLAHWATKSYAEHEALGDFYDEIVDSTDSFIENYQGVFGLVGKISGKFETVSNILDVLKEDAKWLKANREKIAKNIPSLENIIDELTSIYIKTIYKLTNLK